MITIITYIEEDNSNDDDNKNNNNDNDHVIMIMMIVITMSTYIASHLTYDADFQADDKNSFQSTRRMPIVMFCMED